MKKISIVRCENISGRFIREFNFTNVSELKLRGLKNEINSCLKILFWLPELTRIEITNFRILHLTQQILTNNRKLRDLLVAENQKVLIDDNTFSHLESLQILKIYNNQLDAMEFLRKTQNLETLDFNTNNIENLAKDFFMRMRQLRNLHMGRNKLRDLPHGLLDNMTHLKSLIINCNNLKKFPTGLLRHNKNVTHFELDNNSEMCKKEGKTSVPNNMFLSRYLQNIKFRNVAITELPERWLTNCSGNILINI